MSETVERTLNRIAIAIFAISTIECASAQTPVKKAAHEKNTIDRTPRPAGGTESIVSAAQNEQNYVFQLRRRIKENVLYAGSTDVMGNPKVVFRIETTPNGEVVSATKIESSGIQDFDLAVLKGIQRASPIPKKRDGTVDQVIVLSYTLKPEGPQRTSQEK